MSDMADEVRAVRQFAGMWAGVVAIAAMAAWSFAEPRPVPFWLPWIGGAGLLAPAIGWHFYRRQSEAGSPERWASTTRRVMLGGAAIALLGAAGFLWSRSPVLLLGIFGYAILAGAIWPSEARAEAFGHDDEEGHA